MATENALDLVAKQQWLDELATNLQPAVRSLFESAGSAVKDVLHGKWLGHPLHPVLVSIPIGAWTTALALDSLESATGNRKLSAGADAAVAIGLLGAVGSAVTGAADWSETDGKGRTLGLAHALLNITATALYVTSWVMRGNDRRRAGVGMSMLGFAVANSAAYIGGHLVFGEQIGVDHTVPAQATDDASGWIDVLADEDLPERQLTRVDAAGVSVLLLRSAGAIHAITETCSHLGGPLAQGKLEGLSVQCPWHGSRFALDDGSVLEGPATFPARCFEVRVLDGRISVRRAK